MCEPGGQWLPGWMAEPAGYAHKHRLLIYLFLTGVELICAAAIWFMKWRSPIDVNKATSILNRAVSHHFKEKDQINHQYRATLFKIRGCWWLFGQWVGIICRSGETFGRSGTIFSIDHMDPERCTGYVGSCFLGEGTTIISPSLLPVADKIRYTEMCGLAEIEYSRMNVKSVVLFATAIKRNGKMWGFLILDTTDPRQLPPSNRKITDHEDSMDNWALSLGLLLR